MIVDPPVAGARRSWRWSRRRRSSRARSSTRRSRSSRSLLPIEPERRGARAVRGLPRREGRRAGLGRRDVHRRARARSTTGAGPGVPVLPPHRQVHGRGRARDQHRLPGAAEVDVPARRGPGRPRARTTSTFDLADTPRLSLSFYGKRPGRGMHLEKASMQFSLGETPGTKDALEAYERLIYDAHDRRSHALHDRRGRRAAVGDLRAAARGAAPRCSSTRQGSWGPDEKDALIAPRHWRLPFERKWRGNG